MIICILVRYIIYCAMGQVIDFGLFWLYVDTYLNVAFCYTCALTECDDSLPSRIKVIMAITILQHSKASERM